MVSLKSLVKGRSLFDLSHTRLFTAKFGWCYPCLCEDVIPGDTWHVTTDFFVRVTPMIAPPMHIVNAFVHYFFVPNRLVFSVPFTTLPTTLSVVENVRRNAWESFITGFNDFATIQPVVDTPMTMPVRVPYIVLDNTVIPEVKYKSIDEAPNYRADPGSIWDHLYGVPDTYRGNEYVASDPTADKGAWLDALPLRAYDRIWNEWYRDQDLQDAVQVSVGIGQARNHAQAPYRDVDTNACILPRNWEKDYFTSARPWPQKAPASMIPVTIVGMGTVPVIKSPESTQTATLDGELAFRLRDNFTSAAPTLHMRGQTTVSNPSEIGTSDNNGSDSFGYITLQRSIPVHNGVSIDPGNTLRADLSTLSASSGITINDLRLAVQIQKFFERCARDGTRYVEFLMSHFGVRSSDARLDRPEFLGGGRTPLHFSEVIQTSSTDASQSGTPQGNMSGHGVAADRINSFKKTFEEHGWIIGIFSALPRTSYCQRVDRRFTRLGKFDWYFPEFAHLGEQAVLTREVAATSSQPPVWRKPFGYQGRWDEYRRRENSFHGAFRESLDFYHFGMVYDPSGVPPVLNSNFIIAGDNVPMRPFYAYIAGSEPLWVQMHHHITVARPIPKRSIPGFMDHF